MNKKLKVLASVVAVALAGIPLLVSAQYSSGAMPGAIPGATIDGIVFAVLGLVWPIFMGFAVIMFFLAGFKLLNNQGDGKNVTEARDALIWGVAGVAVGLLALTIPWIVRRALGI